MVALEYLFNLFVSLISVPSRTDRRASATAAPATVTLAEDVLQEIQWPYP